MKTKKEWLKATIKNDSINAAAAKADMFQSTLSRQLASKEIPIETIIKVARGYKLDVVGALLEIGELKEQDLKMYASSVILADATDAQLIGEMARRIAKGSTAYDTKLVIVENEEHATVAFPVKPETSASEDADKPSERFMLAAHDPASRDPRYEDPYEPGREEAP